jgi:hypothetical protein
MVMCLNIEPRAAGDRLFYLNPKACGKLTQMALPVKWTAARKFLAVLS